MARPQSRLSEARQHLLLGELGAAEAALRKAVRQAPRDATALTELGILLLNSGRVPEARDMLARAAAFDPRNPDRHANAAAAAAVAGDAAAAIAAARRALALAPGHLPALTSLARVLAGCGEDGQARDAFLALLQRTAESDPLHREAAAFIVAQAERLAARGDLAMADDCARRLIAVAPQMPAGWQQLGIDAGWRGAFARAAVLSGRAVTLAPGDLAGRLNRAGLAGMGGNTTAALADLAVAQALAPDHWIVHANRAAILDKAGELAAALASARRAVVLHPTVSTTWANLIILGLRTEAAQPDRDARSFGAVARDLVGPPRQHAARTRGSRLRIGYYSADFRSHSCAWFIEPLLEQHDRAAVETIAYAELAAPDAVTERLRPLFDRWRPTHGIDDAALADQIAADGIDVLVDLTGLFAGGRPLLFARRPAPVQVNWLGYNATTGIAAIDWKLVDGLMAPAGAPLDWFAEKLWRLPRAAHCWRPPGEAPAPTMPQGRPTFGSFNNLAKLSPETIALWAEVLKAVPDARLLLKAEHSGDGLVQARLRGRFAAAGIAPDRIDFLGYAAGLAEHLDLYRLVDVALDPLPYNGTTTTCEAFWMGVPVVTLAGSRMVARIGTSLAGAIGHPEFVAATGADYVAIACRLMHDRAARHHLRYALRNDMARSPLRDEAGFARAIEAAYHDMVGRGMAGLGMAGHGMIRKSR